MAPRIRSSLLGLALFGGGAAAGALGGSLASSDRSPACTHDMASPSPLTGATNDVAGEMNEVLREMREMVLAFRSTLDDAAKLVATGPSRTPIRDEGHDERRGAIAGSEPGADAASLVNAMQELSRVIEARPAAYEARTSYHASLPPAETGLLLDKKTALAPLRLPNDIYDDRYENEVYDETVQRMRSDHRLWSTERLAETYGQPTELWFDDDVATWYYEQDTENGYEGYAFQVKEGTVFSADIEWGDEDDWMDFDSEESEYGDSRFEGDE